MFTAPYNNMKQNIATDLKDMSQEYEIAREKERQRLLRIRKLTDKANISLVKALKFQKGYKYLVIFPKSTGLTPEDVARINLGDDSFDISFMVDSAEGIKVKTQKK